MRSLLATIGMILIMYTVAQAEPVTPYGDFCPKCSHYGYCQRPLSMAESIEAIKEYYKEKGLRAEVVGFQGRFIKVNVFRKSILVDTVIFDRRTGRLRSVQ